MQRLKHSNSVRSITLHKPFQMQEVVARVHTHLEIARSRKELEETMSENVRGERSVS